MKLQVCIVLVLSLGVCLAGKAGTPRNISVSTSSFNQVYAPGDLIFQDEFDSFNYDLWQFEVQMNGGGNHEFQIYDRDGSNSYIKDGKLWIRPSLTADRYGEDFLYSGTLRLEGCTDDFGCATCCGMTASGNNIIPPVISGRLRTKGTFSFTYGRVEVRARLPLGDWQWPAIWLLPEEDRYGYWPTSGEIDLMESRGNAALWAWSPDQGGPHIGVEQVASTLHFGPQGYNGFMNAHYEKNSAPGKGYDQDYHLYQLEWTPDYLKFSIDNQEYGRVQPGNGGMFELGGFPGNVANPWTGASNFKMAPFDQKFHFVLNVAAGGDFFPDGAYSTVPKPWSSGSSTQFLDFWRAKNQWWPSWNSEEAAMAIDYIRVYAV